MATLITGRSIGSEICKVLGLDASLIKSIDIHIEAADLVKVTTIGWLSNEQGKGLTEVLNEYNLVKNGSD